MTQLTTLRRHLQALSRRRQAALWAAGLCALGLATLWSVVVLYWADWSLNLPPAARIAALAITFASSAVVFHRWTWPSLAKRESDVDIALLVEKQQHIDSDLVAALEFESPAARHWGSAQLESAVINYVSDFSSHLDLEQGATPGPLFGRAVALAVTVVLLATAIILYPDYVHTFADRMLLGSSHYPVNTHIDRVVINDQVVGQGALAKQSPRSPYGEPVRFAVHASGQLPKSGTVELSALGDGVRMTVELLADDKQPGVYHGELSRLVDSVRYRVLLGDAWTEPAELLAIPLPVVTIALEPTPPDYAVGPATALDAQPGARQISIVEGTQVAVRLECANKALRSATLSIGEKVFPLKQLNATARTWRLDPTGTPLAQVNEPVRYEVQVTDVDGLKLAEPIQGFIRIKADRPPRVTAALVTHYVLPSGKPRITYGAADDFGIAQLQVNLQILHSDGAIEEKTVAMPLDDPQGPGSAPPKVVQGRYPLDLGPLSLTVAASEPLVLHVTDERGVLAAMAESDQRSAKQLDAIIQRQLGIGD